MAGREHDWHKAADAETAEFLDDVLEYFQEDENRIIQFEEWQRQKQEKGEAGTT